MITNNIGRRGRRKRRKKENSIISRASEKKEGRPLSTEATLKRIKIVDKSRRIKEERERKREKREEKKKRGLERGGRLKQGCLTLYKLLPACTGRTSPGSETLGGRKIAGDFIC